MALEETKNTKDKVASQIFGCLLVEQRILNTLSKRCNEKEII